ncbi:MAG: flagellar protein FliT [Pseudomonadota bacterium]|nr:flagellar protein FliT [Pseudomonadota bacterium]
MTESIAPLVCPKRKHHLETVLEVTQRMLASAEEAQWDTVFRLQAEQHLQLQKAFLQPVTGAESMGVADTLARIQELTDQVISLVGDAHHELAEDLSRTSRGRKAAAKYRANVFP